jgi:hypothetical protein
MRSFAALCMLLVACYEPDAVDCTIECSAGDDCGEGQVCGSDGFCAKPDVAGTCRSNQNDEPNSVTLVVTISGSGKVTVGDIGTCDSDDASQGSCMFAVTANVVQQLEAIENKDREFISWTSTCSGSSTTCTVTPVTSLTQVGAKFE